MIVRAALLILAGLAGACVQDSGQCPVPSPTPEATPAPTLPPPTAFDLEYPNPDEVPGVKAVYRFAIEWRVMERGVPIPCGGSPWVGGCTYIWPGHATCTIYTEDPVDFSWSAERELHEQRLSYFGHEAALHCARQWSEEQIAEHDPARAP